MKKMQIWNDDTFLTFLQCVNLQHNVFENLNEFFLPTSLSQLQLQQDVVMHDVLLENNSFQTRCDSNGSQQ